MPVKVVTDATAALPVELARHCGITVLELSVDADAEAGTTTSGLSALELCAAYARQLERSGDDGVVAIHLAREFSSTTAAAYTAAAVFDGAVAVVDSRTVGMAAGIAAMAAAGRAAAGGTVAECVASAEAVLAAAATWVYVPKVDVLRKSGRMKPGPAVVSAALLAIKPILRVADGRIEPVGKSRTQSKALSNLVGLVTEEASGHPCLAVVEHYRASDAAESLRQDLSDRLPAGSCVLVTQLPKVLGVHVGAGAVAVSSVRAPLPVD